MALTDASNRAPDHRRMSEDPSEQDLRSRRDVIFVKLGRSLVRLQQIELGMKHLAGLSQMVAPAGKFDAAFEQRRARFRGQTLGSVTEEVARQVLVPLDWQPDQGVADESGPPTVGAGFTIGMSEEARERILANLKDLVERRNFLVHGLIEEYDIWTVDGCAAAEEHLDTTLAFIGTQLEHVRSWVAMASESGQKAASLFEQPEMQDLFFHGILPDGRVWWPTSTIFDLLRAAEDGVAEEGWTSLDRAIEFARSQAPDHTPRRYGCTTWRQVLHESGQFEIRRGKNGADGRGTTWYRSRPDAGETTNTVTFVSSPHAPGNQQRRDLAGSVGD